MPKPDPRANQIHKCDDCGTLRSYGFDRPQPDAELNPLLNCLKCHKATRHHFDHVSNLTVAQRGYN